MTRICTTLLLAVLLSTPAHSQDLDRDGLVGFADFLLFAESYGRKMPASQVEGVWVSYSATQNGEDLSVPLWMTAAFAGGRFFMSVEAQVGIAFAKAGKCAITGSGITLRWEDCGPEHIVWRREGVDLMLTFGEVTFMLQPAGADTWKDSRE